MKKIHTFKCEECNLEITSVNKIQFDYNVGQHIQKHKRQHQKEENKEK